MHGRRHIVERLADLSSGRLSASTDNASVSCCALRAPTTGATTPGRSRTQASATWRGVVARPSAAVATASTILPAGSSRYGSTNGASCSDAPRESDGVPVRYFPVSTPRPSGDEGSSPTPRSSAAGSTSRSTPRWSNEYSICVQASRVRSPGAASCQVAALASCQPLKLDTPAYRTRPEDTARSSACSVSSSGVTGSKAWICQRST